MTGERIILGGGEASTVNCYDTCVFIVQLFRLLTGYFFLSTLLFNIIFRSLIFLFSLNCL